MNYLQYLNENYFREKGYIKMQSKIDKVKIDNPRQYRSRQGRSDKKYIETIKLTCLSITGLLLTLLYIIYDNII